MLLGPSTLSLPGKSVMGSCLLPCTEVSVQGNVSYLISFCRLAMRDRLSQQAASRSATCRSCRAGSGGAAAASASRTSSCMPESHHAAMPELRLRFLAVGCISRNALQDGGVPAWRQTRVLGWAAGRAARTAYDLQYLLLVLVAQLRDLLVQSSNPVRILQLGVVAGVALL